MADRPYRRTMQASAKERVLVEMMLLEHPVTVDEIRERLEAVFDARAPKRQTIYDDLACIETIHQLVTTEKGRAKLYSLARTTEERNHE